MGLLEHHILQERDGIHILLLHLAILLLLSHYDTLGLWREDDTTGRDGAGTAVLDLVDADAGESDFEDTDAIEPYLLSHLEEVLDGLAQFLEHSLDITLLDGCLALDELGELLGADEVTVVDGLGKVLVVGLVETVVVS